MNRYPSLVLAGGCFWGVQSYFSKLKGVVTTSVGYANGHVPNPDYPIVCSGNSGHVECCLVQYDPAVLSIESLLEHFWRVIDPTLINRQGSDIGHQYRTGVYYISEDPPIVIDGESLIPTTAEDLHLLKMSFKAIQKTYRLPIQTELEPLKSYDLAEPSHQHYLRKNPNGYCHIRLEP